MNNSKKISNDKFFKQFFVFTFFFVITSILSFFQFKIQRKEFMIEYDSIAEHLTVLIYWGKYIRSFFYNLFINHTFILPQWDFSIGLGADILTTLHWYAIGEPLNLLAAFFKPEKTVYLYNILLFIRLYLSGISFIAFCNYKKIDRFSSVLGALAYIFCGWIIYCGIRHIYFITPMMYLPLLFLGIEKILADEKPFCFIIGTALACVSNFYFFYILTLLTFIYAIVRFFAFFTEKRLYNFATHAGKALLSYLVGVLIASVIFLPNVASFFLTSRSEITIPVPLFYEAKYYFLLPFCLIAPKMIFSYTFLGFTALFIPALACSLRNKNRENISFLLIFILFIVFLIFPVFGHIFNGFNYLTNRWCFGISFVAALLVTMNLEKLTSLKRREMIICLGLPALLGLFVILLSIVSSKFREVFSVSYVSLLIVCAVLYFINTVKAGSLLKKGLLSFTMLLSLAMNANFRYAKSGYNYLLPFINKGAPEGLMFDTVDAHFDEITKNDKDFFRFEQQERTLLNNAILFGTHANQFYWSENSDEIMSFLRELAVADSGNQKLTSLGKRTYLLSLLNTKYLFLKENEPAPFGFETFTRFSTKDKSYIVYKNKNALPFGVTYPACISKGQFSKLNFAERSEALLTYALLSDEWAKSYPQILTDTPLTKTIEKNKYSVSYDSDIERHGQDFIVKKEKAKIEVLFDFIPDAENYLLLDNFVYNKNNDDCVIRMYLNGEFFRQRDLDPAYWAWGHNNLIQLPELQEKDNLLVIEFETKGSYTLNSLEILSQKTGMLSDSVASLSKEKLENVTFSANKIHGEITVSEAKILSLSIPYSKGWTAYINGEKGELLNTQIMYSGLFIEPGSYTIDLTYKTPYLTFGALASLMGLAIFIMMIILEIKAKKHEVA